MPKMVTVFIDDKQVTVPEGTVVVDAAMKAGINIPVFCYHPKMEPVGMCRMCLVEIGRPVIDRATKEPVKNEDGSVKIQFGAKLDIGCSVQVTEGMHVRTQTQVVQEARKGILEFLLTSHPLDCPICDKGGECPLQNLTIRYGPGVSRFLYDEKMHLAKRVSLGELIYLDRERCIQCGRCVRFQDKLADDPVLEFFNRGRSTEIITRSTPGFDSIFSGNTTDICPVGALTTADFRFGARPWELKPSASICTHCPVGCNLTINVRREAKTGGKSVIKRIMPRQNEQVNEIWICDKGRLGYHYMESKERLEHPLVRKNGELVQAGWDEALDLAASKIKDSSGLVTLVGGRLSNEDLFNLLELTKARDGKGLLYTDMAGGNLVAKYGLAPGSNLGEIGQGSAVLVIASDLHQEAPVWWLRLKQASRRGAQLIVANPRSTRLDKFATHTVRYAYGDEAATLSFFAPNVDFPSDLKSAVEAFDAAENKIIIYGSEGLGLQGSRAVAQTAAAILASYGKIGTPNNGLVAVWPRANDLGAWDMGFQPSDDLAAELSSAEVLLVAAADPSGDDPAYKQAVDKAGFVIVQELFLTETARQADVILPVQAITEREGALTNGERRVQRYYPALPAQPKTRADYIIAAQIAQRLDLSLESRSASLTFQRAAASVPFYNGLTYQRLTETLDQWPIIGRADVYYGGTAYDNHQGLGVQLPLMQAGSVPKMPAAVKVPKLSKNQLLLLPVTRLYDHGTTLLPTTLLEGRLTAQSVWVHPKTSAKLGLAEGGQVEVKTNDWTCTASLVLDDTLPEGVGLIPRSVSVPIIAPQAGEISQLAPVPAD